MLSFLFIIAACYLPMRLRIVELGMFLRVFVLFWVVLLASCSTTNSDVRDIMVDLEDPSYTSLIKVAIESNTVRTSSQAWGRIYTLHHESEEIHQMAESVARFYGFTVVPKDQAQFYIAINEAVPDGGACMGTMESISSDTTYVLSTLTLGVLPAHSAYCLFVTASLYRKVEGDWDIVGDFFSNDGRLNVVAGANELTSYELVVDKTDEAKSLETSIGGLLNQMLYNEAFY